MNSSKVFSMIIYYIFILMFSVQVIAMEQPSKIVIKKRAKKEFTLVDVLQMLSHERQTSLLINAKIPPNGYNRCGKNEFVHIDKDGQLIIGIFNAPVNKESIYFQTNTYFNRDVEARVQEKKRFSESTSSNEFSISGFSGSINSPEVAVDNGDLGLGFIDVNKGKGKTYHKIRAHLFSSYPMFFRKGSLVIFLKPPELLILDLKTKRRIFLPATIPDPSNPNHDVATEIHYVGGPFEETPHLIPLLFKVATNKKKTDTSKEHFFHALYNVDEERFNGWLISAFSEKPTINIKQIFPRIPTQEELKQNVLPENAISRTDRYILELDDKAIDWIKEAIDFIDTMKLPSAKEGIALLKQINDKDYAKDILKLKSRATFVLATRDGFHGDILKAIKKRTETLIQEANPNHSDKEVKNYIKELTEKMIF